MKPRIVYSAITVDLVKGNAARANMFPNYVPIEISESALIPQLIDNTAAVDAAAAVTLKWRSEERRVGKECRVKGCGSGWKEREESWSRQSMMERGCTRQ